MFESATDPRGEGGYSSTLYGKYEISREESDEDDDESCGGDGLA